MNGHDYGAAAQRLMGMDEATWQRHANPWSAWTRVPILPLLALAVYARTWIGWWCLVPIALLLAWTWWNPRAFPPPARLDTWAARGVMGERIWLARRKHPIPADHARAAHVLSAVSLAGLGPLLYGLAVLDPWPSVGGCAVAVLGKLWFVDRMAWLHDETVRERPEALRAVGLTPPLRASTPPPRRPA